MDGRGAERGAALFAQPFGLEGFERHYPAALSGALRQRAALLRQHRAGPPDPALLDEPFGALPMRLTSAPGCKAMVESAGRPRTGHVLVHTMTCASRGCWTGSTV